jgi:putative ABC transport system substrate-binding protein
LGWTEGRNVRLDVRWAAGDHELFRRYATEVVALVPDVIFAASSGSIAALQRVTRTTPVVFAGVIDPVGAGFVTRLGRPGGNYTGFALFEYAISAKWLELLKEIAPRVTRAAVLRDSDTASGIGQFAAIQAVGPIGMELSVISLQDLGAIDQAVAAFARDSNGGLVVTASVLTGYAWREVVWKRGRTSSLESFFAGKSWMASSAPPRARLSHEEPEAGNLHIRIWCSEASCHYSG